MNQVIISEKLLQQILDYVEVGNPGHIADRIDVLVQLRGACRVATAEPAAWIVTNPFPNLKGEVVPYLTFTKQEPHPYLERKLTQVPLYTSPQAQQPVQISADVEEFCCSAAAYAGNKRGVASTDALAIVAAYLHAQTERKKLIATQQLTSIGQI